MAKVAVVQDETNPIVPEVLASAIKKMGDSIKQWERAGLKRSALVALIHDHSSIGKTQINIVLNNMEALEEIYCIKRPKNGNK